MFSKTVILFYILPAMYKGSNSSISSQTLICLFYYSHSSKYEVAFYYGLDFPDN